MMGLNCIVDVLIGSHLEAIRILRATECNGDQLHVTVSESRLFRHFSGIERCVALYCYTMSYTKWKLCHWRCRVALLM